MLRPLDELNAKHSHALLSLQASNLAKMPLRPTTLPSEAVLLILMTVLVTANRRTLTITLSQTDGLTSSSTTSDQLPPMETPDDHPPSPPLLSSTAIRARALSPQLSPVLTQ